MADNNQNEQRMIQLEGRVFLRGNIHAVTGLHVGGAAGNLEIGGVDSPVIRDPLSDRPFIPGSSIRGKMRSLSERLHGKEQNFVINRTRGKEVYIHTCQAGDMPKDNVALDEWRASYQSKFEECPVCSIFGVTGDEPVPHPTTLIVRDARLNDDSAAALDKARTDLPFTEVKWEATIDRVTSAATPRQIERVPAGAVFEGFELVYSIYNTTGQDHFKHLLTALTLVEEDYLGGLGARGSGQVKFELTEVFVRKGSDYTEHKMTDLIPGSVTERRDVIEKWVKEHFSAM